jgi:hypothetical protein
MVVKVWDGTASSEREAAGGDGGVAGCGDGLGAGLVQVGEHLELDAMLANVGDLEGGGLVRADAARSGGSSARSRWAGSWGCSEPGC